MACVTLPSFPDVSFPTTSDLLAPVSMLYTLPKYIRGDISIPYPTLPTIGQPPMGDLNMPSVSSVLASGSMYVGMIPSLVKSALEPLETLMGGLFILIPSVPGVPFTIADLIPPYDPSPIIEDIRGMLPVNLPFVPELWPSLGIPSLQALETFQNMATEVSSMAVTFLLDNVNIVMGILDGMNLEVPALPSIPEVLTMEAFMALLPALPTVEDVIGAIPAPFPPIGLPIPLVPDGGYSDFSVKVAIKLALQSMSTYVLSLLTDFIATLPQIGSLLTLPTLSEIYGAISMPKICHPDIPVDIP